MKQFTKEQMKTYLKRGGNNCPFCGAEYVSDVESSIFGEILTETWECYSCEGGWSVTWKFCDMEPLGEPNNQEAQ